MSGECDECGMHTTCCICDKLEPKLSINEICLSEEIQCQLAPIITQHLKHKRPLIDALSWILSVITNDHQHNLDVFENSWGFKDKKVKVCEENREVNGAYICSHCASRLGAIWPENHVCTWHQGICEFCEEEKALCHTSDWDWPEYSELEEDREF